MAFSFWEVSTVFTAAFSTLTPFGSNHQLYSEFIGSAQKLKVVENLIFGPTWKTAFFSNFYVVYLYILSSILPKGGTLCCFFTSRICLLGIGFSSAIFFLRFPRNRNLCTDSTSLMKLLRLSKSVSSSLTTLLPKPLFYFISSHELSRSESSDRNSIL